MSSPARRSLRVSAAAAGIAALGLGIAGPAFAAPSVPDLPRLPGADATSSPDLAGPDSFSSAGNGIAPAAHTLSDLPGSFQMPQVPSYTDVPSTGPTSLNASAPSDAVTSGIVTTQGGLDQVSAPSLTDTASTLGTNDVGGVPSAGTLAGLAAPAASTGSLTSHQNVGSNAADDD